MNPLRIITQEEADELDKVYWARLAALRDQPIIDWGNSMGPFPRSEHVVTGPTWRGGPYDGFPLGTEVVLHAGTAYSQIVPNWEPGPGRDTRW